VDYRLLVSTSTKVLDTTKYKCNVNTGGGDITSYVDAGYPGSGQSTTGGSGLMPLMAVTVLGLRCRPM